MNVQQINEFEVLALVFALAMRPKSQFLWVMFLYSVSYTISIELLGKVLHPSTNYYGHVAFYFFLGTISFIISAVFTGYRMLHAQAMVVVCGVQSIMCFYIAFSSVEVFGFTIPSFEYIVSFGHFINANVIMAEIMIAFHYAGFKHKRLKW